MKQIKVVLGLVLLLLIGACGGSEPFVAQDNDWGISGLRGKVKRIMERSFQAQNSNGEWKKGPIKQTYSIKQFDKDGFNVSEMSYYNNDNSVFSGTASKYDADKNLIRIEKTGPDGKPTGHTAITSRIGKVRPSTFESYFASSDTVLMTGTSEMTWNKFQIVETKFYDPEGKMITKSTTTYDKDGNIDQFTTVRIAENQTVTMKYTYLGFDEKGNWTSAMKELIGFNYREITERTYEYYPEGN